MRYGLIHNHIFGVDENYIIQMITDINCTMDCKRIGSARNKYVRGKRMPDTYSWYLYDSIEILKKANKLYDYEKDLDTCGQYISYYQNGKIQETYFHNKGKKEGIYLYYISSVDSKLYREAYYTNNMLHGTEKIYYVNGNIKEIKNYVNGVKCGEYISYYDIDNPKLYEKWDFVNNERHGEYYREEDTLIYVGKYKNNKMVETTAINKINKNIKSKQYIYENDPKLYITEKFYDSGILKEKYTIDENYIIQGEYIKYYENGIIQSIEHYENNKIIVHKTIKYYENGDIQLHKIYDADNKDNFKIVSYYDNGKIEKILYYITKNSEPVIIKKENYNKYGILSGYTRNIDIKNDVMIYVKK